ncbi:unnamed protein product, partial [Bubo scandiacus]
MVPVPVAALWALAPLLAGADEPAVVTVTAAVGEDTCLPCDPRPWGHLRGVTLTCTHRGGPQHPPTLVLSHRLGQHPPPTEPGWHPPEEPGNRFRGRVAFCGAGATGLGLLLRNVSHPDFGNYSCEAGGGRRPTAPLQPRAAAPRGRGPRGRGAGHDHGGVCAHRGLHRRGHRRPGGLPLRPGLWVPKGGLPGAWSCGWRRRRRRRKNRGLGRPEESQRL